MTQQDTKTATISLFLVILIDSLGWGIVYPIFEPIIINNATHIFSTYTSVNVRNFWYEAMIGIYMLFMFIMSPMLGSLSDRYGRRIILALCMLGNATGFLISGLGIVFNSLMLIILGRIISGATAGSLPIAQAAMMDICSDVDKPKYLSLVVLANLNGFAFGPALGSLLLNKNILFHTFMYSFPFWITVFIGLTGFSLVLLLFKETFIGNTKQKINILTGVINLFEAFTLQTIRKLCLVFIYFMLAWAMFFSTIPLALLTKFHWQASTIGFFVSFMGVVLGLGVLFIVPQLIKIAKLNTIITFSFIALLLCTILFSLINRPLFLWLVIILSIATPLSYVGLASLFSRAVDINEQGKIMGVLGSLVALTWGVGPMVVGYVVSFGFIQTYIIIGILFLAALILFLRNATTL